jgi:hypothetical protein
LYGQIRSYCFCGDAFGSQGTRSEAYCDMPCSGDSSQICGAGWANSVYEIIPVWKCPGEGIKNNKKFDYFSSFYAYLY